jgi:hypothetical protein
LEFLEAQLKAYGVPEEKRLDHLGDVAEIQLQRREEMLRDSRAALMRAGATVQ